MPTNAPRTRVAVTAIIVAHDGARFLPALIQALKAQTYPVEQTVGVDTASADGSKNLLAELIGQDAVVGVDRSAGFGEAVAAALRHAAQRHAGQTGSGVSATSSGVPRAEWIWLLHDDCEPAPDALERLLRAAGRDRAVAVVGPKVLDAQDRRTLREVGVSIDRAGRRVTGIDYGEIDQGQHDHKRGVLAVSSAGMLVRRDLWERLRGFDQNLKFFRDDVDFCWRVQAAGLRVHVATDAVMYHWELAGRGRRPVPGDDVRAIDQRNALFVLAVNLPLLAMLRIVGPCLLGSLARACYFLLTKQLDLCAAYAFSVLGLFAHPIRLFKGRRRRAAGLAEGYYAVRIFIPPARTLTKLAEQIAALVSSGPPSGRHQARAEESEEDAQFVDQVSVLRRVIGHTGVQLFLALLVITLIATRRLLGTHPLGGGALVPPWGGALSLWQEYLAGFHALSVGSSAIAPPYLAVVAFLATLLGGQAWLAVDVLLLGCVPLAGLTAYVATRWIVTAAPARVLLAASYALLPVATGVVAAGRLGTAVAFILLPLIAVNAGQMLTAVPRQARRAAWATGLLIGLAAAFAPFTWVLGALFAVAAFGVRRWLAAVDPLNAAIVVVAPFFVLFPWSLQLLASPSAFLSEAGLSTPGLTTHGLGATALLALSPGGPGVPPVWVTAGFALALVALLLPTRRLAVVVGGWAVAVTGLLAAVVLSRVTVTPPVGGQPADGWPGIATALAALGLLIASAPAAQWLVTVIQNGAGTSPSANSASGRGQRFRRLLASAALVGAATAPLSVAAYWVTDGVRGPVGSISAPLLPTFISASSTSGEQYRTLILRPDGAGLDYQVVRQGDPSLGQPELGISAAAQAALSRQVAALGARDGADAGDPGLVLGSFGIKWVLLPSPVDPLLASRLDASIGLVALNKGSSYDLWQVTGAVGRVRVVGPSGATTVLASQTGGMTGATAPASGGTLILAEPYGGWTATLNGQALKPVASPVGGWAQGFVLPPGGGQLSITHNGLPRLLSLILELVATLAVIVAALPGKRADPAEEAQALSALREAAKVRPAAQRPASRRAVGQVRPRSAVGHRAVNRALTGAGRLGVDVPGLGRKRRAGPASAGEAPPESPALGNQLPAQPDAEAAALARAESVTATARAERGHGRHRGLSAAADTAAADTAAGGTAAGDIGGDAGTGSTAAPGGAGGHSAAPWETGDGWDGPAPARARRAGQQPAAPKSSEPESPRWGTGALDVLPNSAAGAGQGDDQPAGPESAAPESPPWAAGPLDTPNPSPDADSPDADSPDAEEPEDPARRKTANWKGAFARLTGQQSTFQEDQQAEPAVNTVRPLAEPERQDDSDWLAELLRTNGVARPSAAAETAPPAADRGMADSPVWKNDHAPRTGRHAANPVASPQPLDPASSPRGSQRPQAPAPGSPAQETPARETPASESRPPWEAGPRRAPWESGPQPPVPGAGKQPRRAWESGPQPGASAAGTQPRKPWESGPQPPVAPTRAPSASPADSASAWRTEARSAWEADPLSAAPTGAQPVSRTGAQPTFTPTGPQPTFTPTGPRPTFTPTGSQPAFTAPGAQPSAAPAGPAPVSPPGNPAAEHGDPPAEKPPWESGDWGKSADRDAIAGDRDAVTAAGNPGDADRSQPPGMPGAEPGPAPGNRPAASPPAKPERHRGGKHGKPSRWRGSGSHSGGES